VNPRTTAVLFAVALALGAFVWFYEIGGEDQRRAAEEREKRLFPGVEAAAIDWIALRTSDGRDARIERREGRWTLVAPLEFPADDFSSDAIASALAELASASSFEEPQPPEVYGLDQAANEVRFAAGGQEHALRTGAATPLGGNTYAAVVGAKAVHAVPTFRVNALRKSLDDLRDKRILSFDEAAVKRVSASWPEGRVVLARADGEWRIEAPVEGAADPETVKDLLADLSYLRAVSFADAPPPDAETGLDAPAFALTLELGEPGAAEAGEEAAAGSAPETPPAAEPRRLSFAVGAAVDDEHRWVRAERPTLYRIRAERLEDFPRELMAYRFKQVAKFAILDAEKLEIAFRPPQGEPVAVTATRSEGEWSSEPLALEPAKIQRLVDELSRLEASAILAESAGEQELRGLGLDPPRVSFAVTGAPAEGEEGPGRLAEVRLGELQSDGGLVAQAAGRPALFRLDPALAEHLPVSLDALRERFLAPPEPAEPAAPAEPDASPVEPAPAP
jgi:hypothetical protein